MSCGFEAHRWVVSKNFENFEKKKLCVVIKNEIFFVQVIHGYRTSTDAAFIKYYGHALFVLYSRVISDSYCQCSLFRV